MTEAVTTTPFAAAASMRRKGLPWRFGIAALGYLVFSPVVGAHTALAWCLVYCAVQFVELLAFRPINSGAVTSPGPLRLAACTATLVLNTAVFTAIAGPLWLQGGYAGGICAILLMASGSIHSAAHAHSSRLVMAATVGPQFVGIGLTPLFMIGLGAAPAVVATGAVSALAFMAYAVTNWLALKGVRDAERAARIQSDRKRAESEAAMASKSAFVAAVSHDLRTPISAMLAGVAELERNLSDPAQRSNAALIGEASRMMKGMLDDLLDHAKLEAGRMTVEVSTFDLRTALAHTIKFWQSEASKNGLKLRVEGAAATPRWVQGDPVRLKQVLNNLISNAVKFTQDGSICLRIKAWDADLDGVALLIEVQDTGPGLDAAQMRRLFNPFDQLDTASNHGGTGLGLSISRDLARLMGGQLTARSRKGEGAVFTLALTLPHGRVEDARPVETALEPARRVPIFVKAPAAPTPVVAPVVVIQPTPEPLETAETTFEETAPEAEEGRPLRILVVDDHEINRRAVQLILTPLGADIATAADGLAALEQLAAQPFDVVFMDVRMPELDGRETTRRLRAQAGPNQAVPVIAVTADTGEDDVKACLNAGMDCFVSKPLTPASLLGALSSVLEAAANGEPAESVAA